MPAPRVAEDVYLAKTAVLMGDVRLAAQCSVWPNAVLRADLGPIEVGQGSNIQDNCVVHVKADAPVHLGRHVTVGHGCILHGCTIGDEVLVGMGSLVMDYAVLEEGCMLGAGSLVTEGTVIPSGMLALGRPAAVVRPLTNADRQALRQSAENYIGYAKNAGSLPEVTG